jgi:hypothetical protein
LRIWSTTFPSCQRGTNANASTQVSSGNCLFKCSICQLFFFK